MIYTKNIYTTSIYTVSKKLLSLMLALFVLIGLSGCTTNNQSTEIKTVKIGVIAPLSGPAAGPGEDMISIYKMAVDEFNTQNTNTNIQLIIEDGKCSGKDATSATQKLINIDKIDILFGGVCSSEVIASAQITQPLKILNFSAAGSSPLISKIGDYVFRFYNDLDDAKFLTKYIQEKGISKVGLIYENSDYAISYQDTFKKLFSGNIVFEKKYNSDEKDFNIIIKSIQKDLPNIEKLILIPQTDTSFISIIKSLDKYGDIKKNGPKIMVSSIARTNTTFESIPNLIEGISSVMLPDYGILGDQSENFINNLKLNYTLKSNALYAVFFKESIDLILRAIQDGNYNSDTIKKYITNFGPQNLINGYRGKYYFTGSDTIGLKMIIQQIQSGTLVTIQ
ncbi:MAG: ABC transporter substrate-binding protein [Candidatus Absconditicoccaceae bacterium]